MKNRLVISATVLALSALPASAGSVSTPNIAGGLATVLAPPAAPVFVPPATGTPPTGRGGGAAPQSSGYVSGFIAAFTRGGGNGGGAGRAPVATGQSE